MGARVFEKHVTLNRGWKGTDHSFALEPLGFRKFVRDIKELKICFQLKIVKNLEMKVFKKLGKSIVAYKDLKTGEVLSLENLSGKIFNETYIPVRESNLIIGKQVTNNISKGQPILFTDLS